MATCEAPSADLLIADCGDPRDPFWRLVAAAFLALALLSAAQTLIVLAAASDDASPFLRRLPARTRLHRPAPPRVPMKVAA